MTLIDTRTPEPKRFIPGATGDWEVIIGMEVHAQVKSEAKLFSGASTEFGGAPNPVGHPQKILVAVESCTCTSKPMTVS